MDEPYFLPGTHTLGVQVCVYVSIFFVTENYLVNIFLTVNFFCLCSLSFFSALNKRTFTIQDLSCCMGCIKKDLGGLSFFPKICSFAGVVFAECLQQR